MQLRYEFTAESLRFNVRSHTGGPVVIFHNPHLNFAYNVTTSGSNH
jgi:hypothetical protein